MSTDVAKPDVIRQFEELASELKRLRERDEAATLQIKDLEKKLSHAEQWVRRLREKCEVLEKKPAVLDGLDENWLWEVAGGSGASVDFRRRLDGTRTISIRSRGHTNAQIVHRVNAPHGDNLLRRALDEASGRERKTKK